MIYALLMGLLGLGAWSWVCRD